MGTTFLRQSPWNKCFPMESRDLRVPQIYKPSAKWIQVCFQPSFFEATVSWSVYSVALHYKNLPSWRGGKLKTTTTVRLHKSKLHKIKNLRNPWCKTNDLSQLCKNYKTTCLPRIFHPGRTFIIGLDMKSVASGLRSYHVWQMTLPRWYIKVYKNQEQAQSGSGILIADSITFLP